MTALGFWSRPNPETWIRRIGLRCAPVGTKRLWPTAILLGPHDSLGGAGHRLRQDDREIPKDLGADTGIAVSQRLEVLLGENHDAAVGQCIEVGCSLSEVQPDFADYISALAAVQFDSVASLTLQGHDQFAVALPASPSR